MFTSADGFPQRVIILLMFCFGLIAHAHEFAGGTGEPNDPYGITTAEQLISIGSDPTLLDKHFILLNDIDLAPNLLNKVSSLSPIRRDCSRRVSARDVMVSRRWNGNDRHRDIPRRRCAPDVRGGGG